MKLVVPIPRKGKGSLYGSPDERVLIKAFWASFDEMGTTWPELGGIAAQTYRNLYWAACSGKSMRNISNSRTMTISWEKGATYTETVPLRTGQSLRLSDGHR